MNAAVTQKAIQLLGDPCAVAVTGRGVEPIGVDLGAEYCEVPAATPQLDACVLKYLPKFTVRLDIDHGHGRRSWNRITVPGHSAANAAAQALRRGRAWGSSPRR
jgi:hypothetical protein